jgi:hypothetical protein
MSAVLLDHYLAEVRLKPENPGLAWLVSRMGSRRDQERVIRHWNRHGEVPSNLEGTVKRSPSHNFQWAMEFA